MNGQSNVLILDTETQHELEEVASRSAPGDKISLRISGTVREHVDGRLVIDVDPDGGAAPQMENEEPSEGGDSEVGGGVDPVIAWAESKTP